MATAKAVRVDVDYGCLDVAPMFGDPCQCGASVVEAAISAKHEDVRWFVLCHWRGKVQPWVVWEVFGQSDDGLVVGSGVYCYTLRRAVEVWTEKVAASVDKPRNAV